MGLFQKRADAVLDLLEVVHRRHQDVCKQRGYEDWAQKAGDVKYDDVQGVDQLLLSKGTCPNRSSPGAWERQFDCCPNEVWALAEDT